MADASIEANQPRRKYKPGKILSEEHRRKIALVHKGRKQSADQIARRGASGLKTRNGWSSEKLDAVRKSISARKTGIYSGDANPNWRGGYADKCTQCGSEVWVKPSRAHKERRFCSKHCASVWMAANIVGEKSSSWGGGESKHSCKRCNSTFTALPSKNRMYCSRECSSAALKNSVTHSCAYCGAEFVADKSRKNAKFCSRQCKHKGQSAKLSTEHKKLNHRMTVVVYFALRSRKGGASWERHVGYTLRDLVEHLESLFEPGMTWDNIGEWHLDHIKPRSSFSYETSSDPAFKECWGLANLQPLWARDNMSKGARLDWKRDESRGAGRNA